MVLVRVGLPSALTDADAHKKLQIKNGEWVIGRTRLRHRHCHSRTTRPSRGDITRAVGIMVRVMMGGRAARQRHVRTCACGIVRTRWASAAGDNGRETIQPGTGGRWHRLHRRGRRGRGHGHCDTDAAGHNVGVTIYRHLTQVAQVPRGRLNAHGFSPSHPTAHTIYI